MTPLPRPVPEPADAGWTHWRATVDDAVELGTVRGHEVALPTHFHAEDQITFVVAGRRRFLVGGEPVALTPGRAALIPAGVAHRSRSRPASPASTPTSLRPAVRAVPPGVGGVIGEVEALSADVLLVGHMHVPSLRRIGRKVVLNPATVEKIGALLSPRHVEDDLVGILRTGSV